MGTVLVFWTKFTTCWSNIVLSRLFCWALSKTILSTVIDSVLSIPLLYEGNKHKMYDKTACFGTCIYNYNY